MTNFKAGPVAKASQKRLSDIRLINRLMKAQGQGPRTPSQHSNINYVDKVVQTPYNYSLLCVYSLYNPVLRLIHDAIIREVLKARKDGKCFDIIPRFKSKCTTCGYESQKEEETCPVDQCPGVMRKPEIEQKRKAEAFFDDPNESSETEDIIKSILRFSLAVDDWFISLTDNPVTIYVEDSRHMHLVADDLGRLGNSEYFCPGCIREAQATEDPNNVQSANQKIFKRGQRCPKHPDAELKETCYVYLEGTTVKARFGKDEIIHGKNDSWLPDLYGHSKVVAVLRQIRSVTAMDKWNFDTYTTGKLGQILGFKKMDQDAVNKIADDAEAEVKQLEENADTGEVNAQLRTLWLATEDGFDVVDTMPPSEKMQSLDWWQLWREVAGAVYGVQPVFMGATEQGKTGYHQQMQILVQNDTTLLYQQMIEEPVNEVLLPRIGVVDYKFKFNEIEEKNELADQQILQVKIANVIQAANADMDAELTEEGEVKIHGKPKKQEMLPFGNNKPEGDSKPPKPEQATSALETTTKSKDKRYTVIEHDANE